MIQFYVNASPVMWEIDQGVRTPLCPLSATNGKCRERTIPATFSQHPSVYITGGFPLPWSFFRHRKRVYYRCLRCVGQCFTYKCKWALRICYNKLHLDWKGEHFAMCKLAIHRMYAIKIYMNCKIYRINSISVFKSIIGVRVWDLWLHWQVSR